MATKKKSEAQRLLDEMTDEDKKEAKPFKFSWKKISIALGVFLVISIAVNIIGPGSITGFAGSRNDITQNVEAFIEANYNLDVEIESVTEESGLYAIKMTVSDALGSQPYTSYATKDGKLLFPTAIPLSEVETEPNTNTNTGTVAKSDKPVFDLFVMSQCPYGTIAEEASFPVVELFGDKIEFNLHFIANDNGDGTFTSLHGQPEVDGDMRQAVIMNEYPDKYMDYILCVNENYGDLEGSWEACSAGLGMDVAKIKTAVAENGADLLSANIALADERSVSGSPTFYINGEKVSVTRTQEGVKQALCSAFNTPPDICEQVLDNTQTSSGSC